MKNTDLLELTIQRFKTRALRVFLTIFGIGIGIAIVYFLVSIGFGLQELVIGRIATSDSLLALEVSASTGDSDVIKVTKETLEEISAIRGVEEYSPLLGKEMQIRYADLTSQTSVQGVKSNYFRLAGIEYEGEIFGDDNLDKVVVTTSVLTMFDIEPDDAIGKEITLRDMTEIEKGAEDTRLLKEDKKMKISGIIEDQNNLIFTNIKIIENYEKMEYKSARVKVENKEMVEDIKSQIQDKGFQVTALTDTLEQLNQVFSATQAMFAAFGIIALFISAVGMFNTMTISLLERTKEIGIMRAIGSTKTDIWQMFLLEALVIGFTGGLLGIIIGFLSTRLVNFILNRLANSFGGESVELFYTPFWFILTIILFSILVGFLTGLFPAKRAAKINPLTALRYE